MTANVRYPTGRAEVKDLEFLPSLPGYARYAAGRIKKEGVGTIRIARLCVTCTEKKMDNPKAYGFLSPRGFSLYIAF
jgi:hypothetical protein